MRVWATRKIRRQMNGQSARYFRPVFRRRALFVDDVQKHHNLLAVQQPNSSPTVISVFERASSIPRRSLRQSSSRDREYGGRCRNP